MTFCAQLKIFEGPLDLLLYLIRKNEVEIVDVRIAQITSQFIEYIELIQQLDLGEVGEFLAMASVLVEMKSQTLLPGEEETFDDYDDPKKDLVRQLLEYKSYRDAACSLEDRSRQWQQHYARQSCDLPPLARDPAEEPIHDVELWDLVSAMGRILRESAEAKGQSNIVYDDTPIHVHMERIHDLLKRRGRLSLSELYEIDMHKSMLIGIFLATLELVRNYNVRVEQEERFGQIWICAPDAQEDAAPETSEAA